MDHLKKSPAARPIRAADRAVGLTLVTEWKDGGIAQVQDYLVGEQPLAIHVDQQPLSVTMRTPGHDLELAAGFLFSEGIVSRREQITALTQSAEPGQEANLVHVELHPEAAIDPERLRRNFISTSSCGLCGRAAIDDLRVRGIRRPNPRLRIDPEVLCRLPDMLRSDQKLFSRTGGPHAAGLFDHAGRLLTLREDVGRHNAVDKLIGWALLNGGLPLAEHILLVSGRGSFEIIQKALVAGLPAVACISAPSSLAVQLAQEFRLTLVGFLRGRRFIVYAGEERLSLTSPLSCSGPDTPSNVRRASHRT
ncbi:MAG: formate dehydrogenase accessory sulfurtransferase FdhD [Nitrospira sp.]|nr:MAG: formate dehydrogenase accessory sulfurtransferase FdhD [Nitrospira sp.]